MLVSQALDGVKEELSFLAERIEVIEEKAKLFIDRKSTRETIPALFRRAYDENFLSDYLAYILDPARNGIGGEPLQALLSLAFDDSFDLDLEEITILREYTFEDQNDGRIDLLIKLGVQSENGVIGIENKIYATEQGNQTLSYAQGFKKDFKGCAHYLIFLTPDGRLPLSKEFKVVSYVQLCQALREIRYPVLNDIHKCVIWEDFLAHLEEYIAMSKGKLELSGKTRLYLEHRQILETLNNAYEQDAQKVYDYVTASIKNCFGEEWNCNFQGRNPYQEINRDAWKMGKYYLFFQYRFSRDNLLFKDQLACMLGAYPGRHAGSFVEWLKANDMHIPEICQTHEMDAYPKIPEEKGNLLIAYKLYPLSNEDIPQMEQQLVRAAQEFSEFIPVIDEMVRIYKITNPAGL